MKRALAGIAMLSLMLVFAGCGSSDDKAEKKSKDESVTVDASEKKVVVETGEEKMTISEGGGAEIPEGFPKDILVYKGAAITMSMKTGDTFMLHLTTTDDAKKAAAAYREAMKSEGWKETISMSAEGQTTLGYEKEGRECMVAVTTEGGKTLIVVTAPAKSE